jgi:hypothetical protein
MDIFKARGLQGKKTLQLRQASLPLDLRKNLCGGNRVLKLGALTCRDDSEGQGTQYCVAERKHWQKSYHA